MKSMLSPLHMPLIQGTFSYPCRDKDSCKEKLTTRISVHLEIFKWKFCLIFSIFNSTFSNNRRSQTYILSMCILVLHHRVHIFHYWLHVVPGQLHFIKYDLSHFWQHFCILQPIPNKFQGLRTNWFEETQGQVLVFDNFTPGQDIISRIWLHDKVFFQDFPVAPHCIFLTK